MDFLKDFNGFLGLNETSQMGTVTPFPSGWREGEIPVYNEFKLEKFPTARPEALLKPGQVIEAVEILLKQKEEGIVDEIMVTADVPTQGNAAPQYLLDELAAERKRLRDKLLSKFGGRIEAKDYPVVNCERCQASGSLLKISFTDPVTGEISKFSIPVGGRSKISFLGQGRSFSDEEVSTGELQRWFNSVYSDSMKAKKMEVEPDSESVEVQQTIPTPKPLNIEEITCDRCGGQKTVREEPQKFDIFVDVEFEVIGVDKGKPKPAVIALPISKKDKIKRDPALESYYKTFILPTQVLEITFTPY